MRSLTVTLARKALTRSASSEICERSASGVTERTRRIKVPGGSASAVATPGTCGCCDTSDMGAGEHGACASGTPRADELDTADVMDDMVDAADVNVDGGDDLDRTLDGVPDETGEDACHGTFDRPSIKGESQGTRPGKERGRPAARPAIAEETIIWQRKKGQRGVQPHAARERVNAATCVASTRRGGVWRTAGYRARAPRIWKTALGGREDRPAEQSAVNRWPRANAMAPTNFSRSSRVGHVLKSEDQKSRPRSIVDWTCRAGQGIFTNALSVPELSGGSTN